MSPYEAKTLKQVCALKRDNFSLKSAWILTDGCNVTITEQKNGESATQSITLSRAAMNGLIRWYVRDQKTKP